MGCLAITSSRRPRRRPISRATTACATATAPTLPRGSRCMSGHATRASATSRSGGSWWGRRPAADPAAVRRDHAPTDRPGARAGDRLAAGAGEAPVTYDFEAPAAEFALAVGRVFGEHPRVLDGSRGVLVAEVKLQLEAG